MEPRPPDLPDRALAHRSFVITGVLAATFILLVLVWYLIDVLMLVFAGVLLAIVLRTPADWLARRAQIPPPLALALVLIAIVSLIGTGIWLFGQNIALQMAQLTQELPRIVADIMQRLESYDWIFRQVQPQELFGQTPEFIGRGLRVISTTFGAVASFVIVVFLGIFFAIQPDLYIRGLVQLFPLHMRGRALEVLYAVGHILRWWLLGQLTLMAAVGVMTGVGLWFLGVPLALALAVLSGLLNFVPYVGPILAAIPAVLVALPEGALLAGYVALLYAAVQSLEGYVLEPVVQQRAVYLPPALILLAQIVLGVLIGPLGVMLATPLAAALMVVVKMVYVEDVLGARGKEAPRGGGD